MKRGFTLVEILVVLIILGTLSTLGFTQYMNMLERGRMAEAKSNLGLIRTFAVTKHQETGSYPNSDTITRELGLPTGGNCNPGFYFRYAIATNGTGLAVRCTAGGREPNGREEYRLSLDVNGTTGERW